MVTLQRFQLHIWNKFDVISASIPLIRLLFKNKNCALFKRSKPEIEPWLICWNTGFHLNLLLSQNNVVRSNFSTKKFHRRVQRLVLGSCSDDFSSQFLHWSGFASFSDCFVMNRINQRVIVEPKLITFCYFAHKAINAPVNVFIIVWASGFLRHNKQSTCSQDLIYNIRDNDVLVFDPFHLNTMAKNAKFSDFAARIFFSSAFRRVRNITLFISCSDWFYFLIKVRVVCVASDGALFIIKIKNI